MKEREGAPNGLNESWVHDPKEAIRESFLAEREQRWFLTFTEEHHSRGAVHSLAPAEGISHALDWELPSTNPYAIGGHSSEFSLTQ